jgi:hypothetical protein
VCEEKRLASYYSLLKKQKRLWVMYPEKKKKMLIAKGRMKTREKGKKKKVKVKGKMWSILLFFVSYAHYSSLNGKKRIESH